MTLRPKYHLPISKHFTKHLNVITGKFARIRALFIVTKAKVFFVCLSVSGTILLIEHVMYGSVFMDKDKAGEDFGVCLN